MQPIANQMEERILRLRRIIDLVLFYLSIACSSVIVFQIGYNTNPDHEQWGNRILEWVFLVIALALVVKSLTSFFSKALKISILSEALLCLYFFVVTILNNYHFSGANGTVFVKPEWIYLGIFLLFMVEISKKTLFFDRFYFNPTLLFVLSFLSLILIGTALLLLPKSTYSGQLSFVDALFMSTSAVCITGLSVINVATELTAFGQTVLLILVQIGGLGIMTFTGFFGYFFSGGFSFKNQVMYTEMMGESKVASIVKTLYKIILVTLAFEAAGVSILFFSVDGALFNTTGERLYFSVYHAINAFCNAGFSIAREGLQDPMYRFNYNFQLSIVILFVLGGLGFGIVFNTYEFIKRWAINLYQRLVYGHPFKFKARAIDLNSKVIGVTSLILIAVGSVSVFLLEYDHGLQEHRTVWGKMVTALFMGTTPRSSGFSTVDLTNLAFPTIMLILFLMWVGAAPGSTGGGIKVTTFAVACLNILKLARGKDRIEVLGRTIPESSVSRAFGVIFLSLIFLGLSVFTLTLTDEEIPLFSLVFESFSAFSTTGLSLGITDELSNAGKLVITSTMFVGRVGALTLMIAVVRKAKPKNYQFPNEQMSL